MAEFPTIDALAKEVAEKALDYFVYEGKTIREWSDLIAGGDVVHVVRCKECMHYNLFRLECHNGYMNGVIGIDGFCAYGERKTNE